MVVERIAAITVAFKVQEIVNKHTGVSFEYTQEVKVAKGDVRGDQQRMAVCTRIKIQHVKFPTLLKHVAHDRF
jgi:hypothetical protein